MRCQGRIENLLFKKIQLSKKSKDKRNESHLSQFQENDNLCSHRKANLTLNEVMWNSYPDLLQGHFKIQSNSKLTYL